MTKLKLRNGRFKKSVRKDMYLKIYARYLEIENTAQVGEEFGVSKEGIRLIVKKVENGQI